jgi:two-component system response regulator YesN
MVIKLRKSGLPVGLVREFPEGESVLQYIDRGGRPDIMICDIKMPGVDGLSLAAILRKRLPDLRIIIGSGYGEFEYAKQAIRVGVSEYLLKPIDNTELYVALKSCMESISLFKRNGERLSYLQMIERENRARSRLVRVPSGRGGGGDNGDWSDLFPAYRSESARFICAYFHLPQIGEADFHDMVNRAGPQYLDGEAVNNSVLYSCAAGEYVLLFLSTGAPEEIKALAAALSPRIRSLGGTVGLSGIGENPDQTVMEALELMKYGVLLKHNGLICPGDTAGRNENYRVAGHHLSALRHALEEGNEKALAPVLDTLKEEIDTRLPSYRCLENAYLQILLPASEILSAVEQKSILFIKDAYKFTSLGELFDFIGESYRLCLKINERTAAKGKAAIIRDIARSIDEHFNEYLTLDYFAAAYNINASYLSLLFKEVIGMHFQEYLSSVRIRNAKDYLTSGRYSIAKVAEKTGYTSRFYFSRAFKKIEGLTPTEFMNTAVK